MNSERVRVVLVGYGQMGARTHTQTVKDSGCAEVVGIVRVKEEADGESVPVFRSVAEACDLVVPDLAIVATPNHLHYEQARLCLELGCHVLVEKPMTLDFSESETLVRIAAERERYLVVGLQRRYEGLASIFRQLRANGSLGRILLVHGLFAHRFGVDGLSGWRSDPAQAGAGIVDDSAIHLIDLLVHFSGGLVTRIRSDVLKGEDSGLAHSFVSFFRTDSGVTVSACGSYLSPMNSVQEEISIWGTRGSLFARRFCREWNADPPAVFYKSADGSKMTDYDLSGLPSGRHLPLRVLLKVLTGQMSSDALLTQAANTLESHRVIEMIRRQSGASSVCVHDARQ